MFFVELLAKSKVKRCRLIAAKYPFLSLKSRIELCCDHIEPIRHFAIQFLPYEISNVEIRKLGSSIHLETRMSSIKFINEKEIAANLNLLIDLCNDSTSRVRSTAIVKLRDLYFEEFRQIGFPSLTIRRLCELLIDLCDEEEDSIRSVAYAKLPILIEILIQGQSFNDRDISLCCEALVRFNNFDKCVDILVSSYLNSSVDILPRVLYMAKQLTISPCYISHYLINLLLINLNYENLKKTSKALRCLETNPQKIEILLLNILLDKINVFSDIISAFRESGVEIPKYVLEIHTIRFKIRNLIIKKEPLSKSFLNDQHIDLALRLLFQFGDFEVKYYFQEAVYETRYGREREPTEEEIEQRIWIMRTDHSDTQTPIGAPVRDSKEVLIRPEKKWLSIEKPKKEISKPILNIQEELSHFFHSVELEPTELKIKLYKHYTKY